MSKLIIGCGYLGSRVARLWCEAGEVVHALTRRQEGATEFERLDIRPHVGDVTRPETLGGLPAADAILFAVGLDRASGNSAEQIYVAGLQNLLNALPDAAGSVVFISTTGVYAQDDGSWVDECSVCQPQRDSGQACLAAEQLLANHPRGHRATILRMAGLYGPHRVPRAADLRAGRPIPSPAEGYLNLVHVEDAATVVTVAARRNGPQRIFNVSDGHPVVRRAYFEEVARLLGATPPSFEPPPPDSPKRARGTTSKRVRNTRMLDELGVALKFPSYRHGLPAILADEQA